MSHDLLRLVAVAVLGLAAIGIGGPLATLVFRVVDHGQDHTQADDESVQAAGSTLRGGRWIGRLERAAVFATLVAGWPEGLALILAVKGLGRYPELRSGHSPGVAERFIIGTFVSVLFACACAGLAWWLIHLS